MKIVVADDSAEMRRLIRSLLPPGVEVIECADGLSALRAYREHSPGWILLDINMSPLDGLSVARALKARTPHSRIIMVTAHDEPRWRTAAARLGVCGFVLKDELARINQIIESFDTEPPALPKEPNASPADGAQE